MRAHIKLVVNDTTKHVKRPSSKAERYKCVNCGKVFGCGKCGKSRKCPRCKSSKYVVSEHSPLTKAQIDSL